MDESFFIGLVADKALSSSASLENSSHELINKEINQGPLIKTIHGFLFVTSGYLQTMHTNAVLHMTFIISMA